MQDDLRGKRILIQVVPYFGYDRILVEEMQRRGATVDLLLDRPFRSALMHGIAKFGRRAVLPTATKLYRGQLEEFGRSEYDYVLVVNGQTMSEQFLLELRRNYASAKFIFYIWDSFKNKPYALKALKHYDAAFSFDRAASNEYGLVLRPLFYSPEFDLPVTDESDFDLSFVGTAHSDRAAIVYGLDRQLPPAVRRLWFLYLKAPWVLPYQRLVNHRFRGVPETMFSYDPMPREAVRHVFAQSRAILDIEHHLQTGLTIRTFEALGARKKLLTTNRDVVNYDFYDPRNIVVLNRRAPLVDREFLAAPAVELAPAIRQKYSVGGWISDVLGIDR